MSTSATVSNTTPTGPLIDKNGKALYAFLKWMQSVGTNLNENFDPNGDYQGPIGSRATVGGRATLVSILQFISTDGVVQADGIDFAIPYLNKDTDHIADGFGSPLAGGKAAFTALVSSPPPVTPHKWVRGLSAGVFVESQPDFSDLSGSSAPAQVPVLSALNGQLALTQLPAAGLSVTITTAALTTLGTQGSMTFQNGLLVAQVQAT